MLRASYLPLRTLPKIACVLVTHSQEEVASIELCSGTVKDGKGKPGDKIKMYQELEHDIPIGTTHLFSAGWANVKREGEMGHGGGSGECTEKEQTRPILIKEGMVRSVSGQEP